MNDCLESARQNAIAMLDLENWAKKNTPKGKVYKGIKFVPIAEKVSGGFMTIGWKCVPVFRRLK